MKKIFHGKILKLYLDKTRYPNGYLGRLEIVKHPGAALIVPFLDKNTVILIRQYRPVLNKYIWELPAGTLHRNEPPLKCAKREIVEEIGYRASKWKKLGYIYPAPGYTTEKIVLFKATGLKKVKAETQEDEVITAKKVTKAQIRKLLKTGKIVDSKTICALTLTKLI